MITSALNLSAVCVNNWARLSFTFEIGSKATKTALIMLHYRSVEFLQPRFAPGSDRQPSIRLIGSQRNKQCNPF